MIASASKISAPEVSGTVERKRLFRLMDRGLTKPVIWIAAPAGSGKTMLVSGWLRSRKTAFVWYQIDPGDADPATFFMYLGLAVWKAAPENKGPLPLLTPEYLPGMPEFTRRFFEAVCSRLPSSAVIVLDNYQDAPADPILHKILRYGIEASPPGITFVVISRHEVPAQLSRLHMADRLHFIGWSDLRFSLGESKTMALSHGFGAIDDKSLARLHKRTDGWAAGLALMLRSEEQWRTRGPSAETHAILFDYFAEEILSQTNEATRDFLLKTSFFRGMTVPMAERITGNDDARAILHRLSREHYFIESYLNDEVTFKYHPLFREFLCNTASATYSRDETARTQLRAAAILSDCGRFDDAGDMLYGAGEHEALIALILDSAQSMADQGRLVQLGRWLSSIPGERLWQEPWLYYWNGVCSHPFNLAVSERFFGEAFRLFRARNCLREALLAWAGVVACIITQWMDFSRLDSWIDWLSEEADNALEDMPVEFRARIVGLMLICLTFRRPGHPKVGLYEDKAAMLLDEPLGLSALLAISCHLMTHYTKMGLLVKARAVMDLVEPRVSRNGDLVSPDHILWHTVKSSYYALSGEKTECLRENRCGLTLAAESGMHIYDIFMLFFGAMAGFIDSDLAVIDEYLERISGVQGDHGLILPIINRQIIAWKCMLEGDHARAREHVEAAMQQTSRLGSAIEHANNLIFHSLVLFEQGKYEEACKSMAPGSAAEYPELSVYTAYMHLTTQAYFSFLQNDEKAGEKLLREAMAIGARHRIMMHHYWSFEVARFLCTRALELGIEIPYVRELADCHGFSLKPVARACLDRSVPVVIRTLGRFHIQLDNEPLGFGRKAQKKPLEMLKALISFGGADVTKQAICDVLWPDAEGDRASHSFKFTIHRLRQLLQYDEVITLRNGLLSFHSRYCWIDAPALMELSAKVIRLCRENEQELLAPRAADIHDSARQAVELYGGDFLPSDEDLPWTAPARTRIRDKMMRMLQIAGAHMERFAMWEEVLSLHEKSFDIDETRGRIMPQPDAVLCGARPGRPRDCGLSALSRRAASGVRRPSRP